MSDKELPKDSESQQADPLESLDQSLPETDSENSKDDADLTSKSDAPPVESEDDSEAPTAEPNEELAKVDAPSEAAETTPNTNSSEKTENKEETPKALEGVDAVAATEIPPAETPSNEPAPESPLAKATSEEKKEEEKEEEVSSSDDEHTAEAEEEAEEEKDYHALSKEELVVELEALISKKPIQSIKNEVEEIKTEFNAKFEEEVEQKKEEFLAAGGNIIDFHHSTPLKKKFNSHYFDYKEKRNRYYQNLKRDLQANYKIREELIEELKGLLNAEENINTTYKHFKDIQERWHTAGAIPRDKYNTIWNTYRHHVENFYDFLHLNREFRDLDFKHNLDQKLKFIARAEELAQQSDVGKAFRELQMLHKMWKEDVGPVAKEFREEVWEKFSAATKVIHDKRQDYLKDQEKHFEVNYEQKTEIITKISEVAANTAATHKGWQNAMKEVQKLRDEYFEVGKVPRTKAKEIWNNFKEATRNFNREKNGFYKNQKKDQFINLEKKRDLIKTAEDHKESDDFDTVTPLMKKIQQDWKNIGHVPRKDSDKIWKQFKEACNHYFDRVHAERNEANKEEMGHFEAKQSLLDAMTKLKLSGKKEEDLETIKAKITEWKGIGRVPFNKKNIERKFNKVLDDLFGKMDLDKQQAEMIRFENKLSSMASQEDTRKLQNEEFFITKRISETQGEINQLENNLGFFRHAKDDNPLVKEVHENIAKHKEQLDVWKSKLKKIRSLRKQQ